MRFDSQDIRDNGKYASFAYLGAVFFLPLVMCPDSKFGRYCANQGLLVLLTYLALGLLRGILGWIPFIGFVIGIVVWIANLAVFALSAYYTYLVYTSGEARELPLIGQIELIKYR